MSAPLRCRQLLAGRDFARDELVAGQMANYIYTVSDPASGETLLVDPAWAPTELVDLLAADSLRLTGVVLTHYHADHAGGSLGEWQVSGVAELLELVDVPIHIQGDELPYLEATTGLGPEAFVTHGAGDTLALGEGELTLIHTPGHTPGSQCLRFGSSVLTGDTLFLNGCGRTDLPGGDPAALHETLSRTLGALPGETLVLPGHNYSPEPSATMARLRQTNPVLAPLGEEEWLARFS